MDCISAGYDTFNHAFNSYEYIVQARWTTAVEEAGLTLHYIPEIYRNCYPVYTDILVGITNYALYSPLLLADTYAVDSIGKLEPFIDVFLYIIPNLILNGIDIVYEAVSIYDGF